MNVGLWGNTVLTVSPATPLMFADLFYLVRRCRKQGAVLILTVLFSLACLELPDELRDPKRQESVLFYSKCAYSEEKYLH